MLFCRPDFDVSIRTFFASDFASTYPVAARDYLKQVGYMIRKAGQNKYSL